jgi:hypothetical protein
MCDRIDPESVNAEVQPELEDLLEQVNDLLVAQVQIGLFGVELVKEELAAFFVPSPGGTSENASL